MSLFRDRGADPAERAQAKKANTRPAFLTANCLREFRASRLKPPLTVAQAKQTYRKVPATSRPPGPGFLPEAQKDGPARPDEAPKPSTRASVPSMTERRAFTSCNQE